MRDQRQCTDTHARIHAQRERYHWWLFTHANGMAQKQTNAPRKFPSFWQPCIASRTHTYTQWRAHHTCTQDIGQAVKSLHSFDSFYLLWIEMDVCVHLYECLSRTKYTPPELCLNIFRRLRRCVLLLLLLIHQHIFLSFSFFCDYFFNTVVVFVCVYMYSVRTMGEWMYDRKKILKLTWNRVQLKKSEDRRGIKFIIMIFINGTHQNKGILQSKSNWGVRKEHY